MKHIISICLVTVLAGCASTENSVKKYKNGQVPHDVHVESSAPARIEVNHEYVGDAPMVLTILGDRDGTFHGTSDGKFTIRAIPIQDGQYVQHKVFRTGGIPFMGEDRIPKRIFFEMGLKPAGIDVNIRSQ